jgi:hypothetical protein
MPVALKKEKKVYDFTGKNPNDVLTKDELEHYDEGMSLKNKAAPADQVDFKKAVENTVAKFDKLFP